MHFFNPPRYMHLVELIRTDGPNRKSSCSMFGFLDERLGKASWWQRIAELYRESHRTYGALVTMRTMLDDGYSIEEWIRSPDQPRCDLRQPHFGHSILSAWMFCTRCQNLHEIFLTIRARDVRHARVRDKDESSAACWAIKPKAGFYQRKKGEADSERFGRWIRRRLIIVRRKK